VEDATVKVLVAGAGGFIGGHLVGRLLEEGHAVVAADVKSIDEWWQVHDEAHTLSICDLRLYSQCRAACQSVDHVYNLAADMGGIGFIEGNKAACMLSVLINTHLLQAAKGAGVKRYFFSSSACVYRADKQDRVTRPALKEEDAYPAMPEDGYGWEKLFSERMCRHFMEDYGLQCRVARFHNVYGPFGSWNDGREKAPAAICRKVAEAKLADSRQIDVWGDGHQRRSFMWIGDCIEGIRRIMDSEIDEPINLGSSESVTVNMLIDHVMTAAEYGCRRSYDTSKPKGVRGRNSDNSRIVEELGWEPETPLEVGIRATYEWIQSQVKEAAP
jgi:nucleoside-diphosphate-sugar epimerase